jgi:hypothetical protein
LIFPDSAKEMAIITLTKPRRFGMNDGIGDALCQRTKFIR